MNIGVYDSEAEGMKSLDSRKPWEWPCEPEGYTKQDAARDERKGDDDDSLSRLSKQQERPA